MASAGQLDCILRFCENYYQATRGRSHSVFIEEIAGLLRVDDWDAITKALLILSNYSVRYRGPNPISLTGCPKGTLKNLALAFNLRSERRMTLKEMLNSREEVTFLYSSMNEDSLPLLKIIPVSYTHLTLPTNREV
eukprot:TRINITY_DN17139_c0_g1_i1.p1 TRINITY_DN17139_c0_g1~~TRINITY_DN17139_c0_g1_i1.p1  ORF type:complete len:136 (+),score=21.84 TRINITY_DN17139_c0_g1_i1:358-765(+)